MTEAVVAVLLSLALVLSLPVLLTAPVVYTRTRLPGRVRYAAINLATRRGIDHAWLQAQTDALFALGFDPIGEFQFFLHDDIPTYARKLADAQGTRTATLNLLVLQGQTYRVIEVAATTVDGVVLLVTDSPLPQSLPDATHLKVVRMAPAAPLPALLGALSQMIDDRGGEQSLRPAEVDEPAREAVDAIQVVCHDHVAAGVLRYDEDEDSYRPTVAGALLMAARQWRAVLLQGGVLR